MVTHSSKDYLKNMSTEARKVVTSILSKKSNHTQLKKDVLEYYKLRDMSEKKGAYLCISCYKNVD